MSSGGNGDTDQGSKLSLFDACGMAIGGMVGGGIFAVLGEAAKQSGNGAFISFGLAGLLALLTGISYIRLTLSFDEAGGSFSYIEEIAGPRAAGTVVWYLLLGYTFTISLYAFTFGSYIVRLIGIDTQWNGAAGCVIIAGLTGLNLAGVRKCGIAEDILVYSKVAILLMVAATGFVAVEPSEAFPVFESSPTSVFAAAALIFVAYEGFQLLTYDYDDIRDHHKNLPRAIWISIPVVMVLYMLIAFVATGALSESAITEHKEAVLAYVSEPILGRAGFVAVLVAAVFSTASAINATIFACARLAKRATHDRQLPPVMTAWTSGGVPVVFACVTALIAAAVQFFGNLNQITSFSSLVFLLVFATVNLAAVVHASFDGWMRLIPIAGALGCVGAAVALVVDLFRNDPAAIGIVVGIAAVIGALRVLYVYGHSHFLDRFLNGDRASKTADK